MFCSLFLLLLLHRLYGVFIVGALSLLARNERLINGSHFHATHTRAAQERFFVKVRDVRVCVRVIKSTFPLAGNALTPA